ncbi:MAG: hypothetical protein IJT83_10030, partial [Victivallales bacterium]|nr:hypothetical protein [Victivallales bacterium]
GKEHIWVRLSRKDLDAVRAFAENAREQRVTFSSVVMAALQHCATPEYIAEHLSELEEVTEDAEVPAAQE